MMYRTLTASLLTLLVVACGRTDKASQTSGPKEAETAAAPQGEADSKDTEGEHHGAHGHGHGHHGGEPIGHRFENAEDWVAVFDDPERASWQKPEHVVSLMGLHPGHTVADIGAGTGYFLSYLARAVGPGGKVVGIDIEPDMVRHMRERAEREGWKHVRARRGSPNDPGLNPASMDRILIVNTWHHIPDRSAYARKLASALRPRGQVFVVDYTLDSPHGPPKDHRLAPERVMEELEAGGFDARLVEEELPRQYVVAGAKR
ncbi:MAG: class I SAM-dependent methyltransferase [Myxococcota bacterium]